VVISVGSGRNYILLTIGFLILVVFTSGCINYYNPLSSSNSTKNFTFNDVSFDYPANWQVTVSNDNTGPSIVVSKDYYTQLQITITPNYGMSEEGVLKERNNTVYPGWEKISEDTLVIDNQTAHRTIFKGSDIMFFFKDMRFEDMVFVKNNNTYNIIINVPRDEYNSEKQNMELILNSLDIK
jgi:hypothetical protein